jgi:DNA-binding XRE family transcriptional regulator
MKLNIPRSNESELIKKARNNVGLTQQQIADIIKVNIRTYQKIEGGEYSLLNSAFHITCHLLDVLKLDLVKFWNGDYYLLGE